MTSDDRIWAITVRRLYQTSHRSFKSSTRNIRFSHRTPPLDARALLYASPWCCAAPRTIASRRRSLPRLCAEQRGMHSLSAHRCAASPAPALPPRVSFSPELTSEAPLCRWEGISGVGRPPCLAPSIIQSSSYSSSFERAGSPGAAGAAGGGGGAGAGGVALGAGDGALGAGGAALGAGGTASGALASREGEGGAASAAGAGGCAVAVRAIVAISLADAAGGDA